MTRTLAKTLVALGFVGAMAVGTATPSLAQGVYFGGPGFGVEVGRPWYRHHYYEPRPYAYYGRPYHHRRYWRERYYGDWD
jgi:hypothetical protein